MELQRWGHLRVCSWIIYIFPLLTEILEKSAPERCWTVVLIGYCFRDPCRGQWPKYKHLSASELLTWRNFHSRCACLGSAELLGQQKKKKQKKSVRQFRPSCFLVNWDKNTKSIHGAVAGLVSYTLVGIYHPRNHISSPMETYLNRKIQIPFNSLGSASNTKPSG